VILVFAQVLNPITCQAPMIASVTSKGPLPLVSGYTYDDWID